MVMLQIDQFYFLTTPGIAIDIAAFGIDLIPSKYQAGITDTNTDTNTFRL